MFQVGLPDSEVENTKDSKKIVIFMQNGIGRIVIMIFRNMGDLVKYGRSGKPSFR